jgi:group I intron endonuclease
MINGIIYCYTSPSNKKYIGQTIQESKRKSRFKDLTKVYSSGGKLENARKKYLPENFIYEVLEKRVFICKEDIKDILNDLEIYYIELFNTYKIGYNSSIGGKSTYSDKQSIIQTNKHHSEETKQKISDKVKATLNSSNYIKPIMSDAAKSKRSLETSKIVNQYSINGEFIKE